MRTNLGMEKAPHASAKIQQRSSLSPELTRRKRQSNPHSYTHSPRVLDLYRVLLLPFGVGLCLAPMRSTIA